MKKGEIWWASLAKPKGSEPGYRRPVVIVQSDDFNRSRIQTCIAAVITSNLRLEAAPGNFLITKRTSGLHRDSIVNVSQLITIDKGFLTTALGQLNQAQLLQLDEGLRLVLQL